MLQPHVIKIRIKVYGPQKNIVYLLENNRFEPVHMAEIRRASAHTENIAMRYACVDNVRCLNGQRMA